VSFNDVMKRGTQEDLKRLFAKLDQAQLREQPSLAPVDEVLRLVAQLPQLTATCSTPVEHVTISLRPTRFWCTV
jgi:hypothetical protein